LFLYHKTTNRSVYDAAKKRFPNADDVLLMNERGEVTESTIANLIVEIGRVKFTPPVACGLLAGTLRAEMIERGELTECLITEDTLRKADRIWLINSLRGMMPAKLVD